MARLGQDLTNVELQEAIEVLPPGWYEAEVTDSIIKQGSQGDYIQWTWRIIGKPNKIWDIMSLSNSAYPITQKRLKTMAVSCGHKNPNYIADTEELHGLGCLINIKIENTEGYDPKNKITGFKAKNGNGESAKGLPPWAGKAATQKSDLPF